MPWLPCDRCRQSEVATARIGDLRLCQACLERLIGRLAAFRFGQRRVRTAPGSRSDDGPGPWSENAVRALEDAAAELEAKEEGR